MRRIQLASLFATVVIPLRPPTTSSSSSSSSCANVWVRTAMQMRGQVSVSGDDPMDDDTGKQMRALAAAAAAAKKHQQQSGDGNNSSNNSNELLARQDDNIASSNSGDDGGGGGGSRSITTIEDNTAEVIEANRAARELHAKAMEQNQLLQPPLHPDELVPAFVKVRRSAKLVRFKEESPDDLVQLEQTAALPQPVEHPWIEGQPHGDFADITHGDGQINVVGTGEVGFDNERKTYPKEWRGLQPRFLPGLKLPKLNGVVSDDVVVKYSLERTGRGLFATKDIKKGETLMVVKSTAVSLGYVPQVDRLLDMMRDILVRVHAAKSEEELEYLHTWIMQGQQSSMVETWTLELTERLVAKLPGGRQMLDDLQLHPLHIARLAAIIDMNSFVVEGYFVEDRGKGYFPEAGLLNHSCCPNADYDILDEETFQISDLNKEFTDARDRIYATEQQQEQQQQEEDVARKVASTSVNGEQSQMMRKEKNDADSSQLRKKTRTTTTTLLQDEEEERGESMRRHDAQQQYHPHDSLMMKAEEEELLLAQQQAATEGGEALSSTYLFCCRANRDIAAGEEVLIAYVPPEWRHDNRQNVLHDRYKFWCRCERCTPTIEDMSRTFPRMMIGVCVVFLILQMWVYYLQDLGMQSQANIDAGSMFPHGHFWGIDKSMEPDVDPSVQPPRNNSNNNNNKTG